MGYEHWSKTMKTMPFACRAAAFALISILPMAGTARGEDLRVMASGAFTEAYHHLTPEFERSNHIKIFTAYGASMGGAPDSIPSRLQRGEPADLVILAAPALEDLIKQGKIVAGSRVDLARSSIGVAVRAGASKPDISTMEALKNTLLRAKSIAYSSSASGAYLSHELFPRLGIADQIASKCIQVPSGPVGVVVARGDAELGLQRTAPRAGTHLRWPAAGRGSESDCVFRWHRDRGQRPQGCPRAHSVSRVPGRQTCDSEDRSRSGELGLGTEFTSSLKASA
jgi:ABC-type molybdate transport system substrate-binding protein